MAERAVALRGGRTMRDPDLVLRAQRAATVLERAWDRWRTLHGLGAEPMPPVSSYVGYSLEEPWGQPRVVFGVAAEEAEQLAALLDWHQGAGPAGVREPAAAQQQRAVASAHLQVPAQAQAGPPEQLRAAGPPAGDVSQAELPRAGRQGDLPVAPAHAAPSLPPAASLPAALSLPPAPSLPAALSLPPAPSLPPATQAPEGPAMPPVRVAYGQADVPVEGTETALMAFRPGAEPMPFAGQEPEPSPFADAVRAAVRPVAEPPRAHRHAMQRPARQRRASAGTDRDAAPLPKAAMPLPKPAVPLPKPAVPL